MYRAHDPLTDRVVAIKVLHERATEADVAVRRWRREARSLAAIDHPHAVKVFDVGVDEGRLFVVTELIAGARTLTRWVADEQPALDPLVRAFAAVADALAHVHAVGVAHRDVKPDNILVDADGALTLVDFGLAREGAVHTPANEGGALDSSIAGTPAFMAPEISTGRGGDASGDQYSLCASLWFAITGELPPHGVVPPRLRTVLSRGLSEQPERRYPGMRALHGALLRTLPGRREGLSRVLGGVLGGVVLLVALAGFETPVTTTPLELCDAEAVVNEVIGSPALPSARIRANVGQWMTDWKRAHAAACSDREQAAADRQLVCLRGQLAEVDALLHALPGVDDGSRLQSAVARLPSPLYCRRDSARPVGVSDQAWEAQLLRRAEVRALFRAGHYAETITRVDALLVRLKHPVLRAELTLVRDMAKVSAGESGAAVAGLEAAFFTGVQADHLEVAARASYWLVHAKLDQGDLDQAQRWLEHAQSWGDRFPENGRQSGGRLAALAARVHIAAGDPVAALAALDRHRSTAHDPDAYVVLNQRGQVLAALGRNPEAIAAFVDSAEAARQSFGADHPTVTAARTNLAAMHYATGDFASAQATFELQLKEQRAAFGDHNDDTAQLMMSLGSATLMLGQTDRAIALMSDAVGVYIQLHGEAHAATADGLANLGAAYQKAGRVDEAIAATRRALRGSEQALGQEHPVVITALTNLATMLTDADAAADAVVLLDRALKIATEHWGEIHRDVAFIETNRAHALRRLERRDEAERAGLAALAIFEEVLGPNHRELEEVLLGLSNDALRTGRNEVARARATRARTIAEQNAPVGGQTALMLARIDALSKPPRDPAPWLALAANELAPEGALRDEVERWQADWRAEAEALRRAYR